MTRSQIESAIHSGVPFTLRMADGKEYEVPHSAYISLSPKGTFVRHRGVSPAELEMLLESRADSPLGGG